MLCQERKYGNVERDTKRNELLSGRGDGRLGNVVGRRNRIGWRSHDALYLISLLNFGMIGVRKKAEG
jgi:hypothetical protein